MRVSTGAYSLIYDPSVGADERWYVNDHTIVRALDGSWHLFGITHAEPAAPHDESQLAHATAPDLHGPWTRQPVALTVEPGWGETVLWAPHVIVHEDRYWMFVCGGGADMTSYRIQLVTSDDLIAWARHPENPLVVDGYEARDPMVRRIGPRWVMYYTATSAPDGGAFVVAAVESDDLVHWGDRRVVFTDETSGTFGGPTESPFVVDRDGSSYLFIGPDWQGLLSSMERTGRYDPAAYRRTRVFRSEDPRHFDASGLVGTIDSHAAEVVVDADGRMWVTHCGWGQGGVFLAPLRWTDDG